MSNPDNPDTHGTRKVRKDGDSLVVTLPPSAVEASRVEHGKDVKIGTLDGNIILLPWEPEDMSTYVNL